MPRTSGLIFSLLRALNYDAFYLKLYTPLQSEKRLEKWGEKWSKELTKQKETFEEGGFSSYPSLILYALQLLKADLKDSWSQKLVTLGWKLHFPQARLIIAEEIQKLLQAEPLLRQSLNKSKSVSALLPLLMIRLRFKETDFQELSSLLATYPRSLFRDGKVIVQLIEWIKTLDASGLDQMRLFAIYKQILSFLDDKRVFYRQTAALSRLIVICGGESKDRLEKIVDDCNERMDFVACLGKVIEEKSEGKMNRAMTQPLNDLLSERYPDGATIYAIGLLGLSERKQRDTAIENFSSLLKQLNPSSKEPTHFKDWRHATENSPHLQRIAQLEGGRASCEVEGTHRRS